MDKMLCPDRIAERANQDDFFPVVGRNFMKVKPAALFRPKVLHQASFFFPISMSPGITSRPMA